MKKKYLAGLRAGAPVIFGFIPVGIAYAVMARQAGFSIFETIFMSISVFAGASQFMAAGMFGQGASIYAIIIATLILNLRHFIMSTCVMDRLEDGSKGKRLIAAFGVTDESFAIFTTGKEKNSSLAFFFGLITVTYLSWITGSAIGAVASDFLPVILTASLGIALYAIFIGLVIPNVTKNFRLGLLVVLTAVCNTILSQFLATSWALIISTLVCAFAGVFFVDLKENEADPKEDESDLIDGGADDES